ATCARDGKIFWREMNTALFAPSTLSPLKGWAIEGHRKLPFEFHPVQTAVEAKPQMFQCLLHPAIRIFKAGGSSSPLVVDKICHQTGQNSVFVRVFGNCGPEIIGILHPCLPT